MPHFRKKWDAGLAMLMVFSSAALMSPATARAEGPTFLLKARRVYTMADGDGWVIERGMILVRDGKIAEVAQSIEAPPYIDVLDLPDAIVMPGLVSADSWMVGQHRGQESVGAQYRAIDAFDTYEDYDRILAGGVTTVYLNPGRHRLVTGSGAIVKLGVSSEEAILDEASDLVINLGEPAFDPPRKERWLIPPSSDLKIVPSESQRPSSRLTQILQLNESFSAAIEYARQREATTAEGRPSFDPVLSALADAQRRKRVLRIRADRAIDIEQAIDFASRHKHALILSGGREAAAAQKSLRTSRTPIVFEVPVNPTGRAADLGVAPDILEDSLEIPPTLHDLPLAIAGPAGASHGELMLYAALAQRSGLPRRTAMKAVTCQAARILGVDARVGSLQPGRDADFLILNGEPLHAGTSVRSVYVNGRSRFDADVHFGDKLVIRAGRIWTGEDWIERGSILVENGRIVSVGNGSATPPHARVIDAGDDAVVTPGFIDAHGHLGAEGDRTAAAADASIAKTLYHALPEFARVCRAGVTTVMTSAYTPAANGSRVSAIHTAGENPDTLIVRETAGLVVSLRGMDAEAATGRLRTILSAGKKYDDDWKKYEKELAEFKKRGAAPPPEKKEPPKKPDEPAPAKPPEDPVTGTWDGEISGGPLPEPQQFIAKLKLTGEEVVGSIETMFGGGESVGLRGTFRDKHLSLEVEVEIPIGKAMIELDIDRDDHAIGYLDIGGRFRFDIETTRTEKSVPEIKITRKKKKKTEGPEAPKKDEALEPYRALFASRIAILIDVDTRQTIEAVLPLFESEFKVPFALLNADQARLVPESIAKSGAGVVLKTQPTETINGREVFQAGVLSRAGVPLAFQSDAEDAARLIPMRALFAVRKGLDETAALKALTGDAARMLKVDDAVGYLKPGCRGDILIFDGPPLAPATRLQRVLIDGREVHP